MPTPVLARRDARANRERLLRSARDAFADEGAAASLQGIARRAGVGVGTLYRHFPTRADLIGAVFEDEVERWLEASRQALAIEEPWDALRAYLLSILELQAENGMLADVLSGDGRAREAQAELAVFAEFVLERARAVGAIRPDFTLADLEMLVWSFKPLLEATDNAWRRHLAVVLDGLHCDDPTPYAAPVEELRR